MADATQHILKGLAKAKGIQKVGTAQMNVGGTLYNVDAHVNLESIDFSPTSTIQEIVSTDGSYTESAIASNRKREITVTLLPTGDTINNAYNVAYTLANLPPLTKVSLAGFASNIVIGDYNYQDGARVSQTREGILTVTLRCVQYQNSTGSFVALA